jgi:hypothetical protein
MIDSKAHLKNTDRYKEIIICDESGSVEHHDLTRRTLLDLDGISDVIIVTRPGAPPVPGRKTGRGRGTGTASADPARPCTTEMSDALLDGGME